MPELIPDATPLSHLSFAIPFPHFIFNSLDLLELKKLRENMNKNKKMNKNKTKKKNKKKKKTKMEKKKSKEIKKKKKTN